MFTNNIKNINLPFNYKKILTVALAISMLSGFAIIGFSNVKNKTPKVGATGCTLQSSEIDNFDSPVFPSNQFNILNGNTFNGWEISNNAVFNIINPSGAGFGSSYPIVAQSGSQYVDIGGNTIVKKNITANKPGIISFSAFFANWGAGEQSYVDWSTSVMLKDSSGNIVSSGNRVSFITDDTAQTWHQSSITNAIIPTAGNYTLEFYLGDFGTFDTTNYCFTENGLGIPVATSTTPITGQVGTPFPSIIITSSTLADNTVVTFTPAGTTIAINGTIQSGNFVPNAGQIIPADATTGIATGILRSAGVADVSVVTNFTAIVAQACMLSGIENFDSPQVTNIKTLNNVGTSYGEWSTSDPSHSHINIVKVDGSLYNDAPDEASTGNQYANLQDDRGFGVGLDKYINFTSPGILSLSADFALANYPGNNGVFNGRVSVIDFQNNYAQTNGNNAINTPINGNIVKSNFNTSSLNNMVVNPGIYLFRIGFVGNSVIDSIKYCFTASPTLGTPIATSNNPITGTVGVTAFPTIVMSGSSLPDNTVATFLPAGSTTIITGKIISGNFVPDTGQIIPSDAVTGATTGILKSTGITDINVATNFNILQFINPISGELGTSFPTIFMTGYNGSNGSAANFSMIGSNNVILGNIIDGNFVPNIAQTIPLDFTLGNALGTLSIGDSIMNVTTNFTAAAIIISSSITISSSSLLASSSIVLSSTSSSNLSASSLATDSIFSQVVSNSISSMAYSSSTLASSSSFLISSSVIPASSSMAISSSFLIDSRSSTIFIPDTDNVLALVENAAPNNGDGNKDGIQDSIQGNVASLMDTEITPKYVVVSADPNSSCQTLSNVSTNSEIANITLDASYDYPVGFVNFSSPCATSINIKIYWYGLDTTKNYTNRKFNPVTNTYTDVEGITSSIEIINGLPVLTYIYTVSDNGTLDTDSTVGTITDPIGPVLALVQNNSGASIIIANSSQVIAISSTSNLLIDNPQPAPESATILSSGVPKQFSSSMDISENKTIQASTIRTGASSIYVAAIAILSMSIILIFSTIEKPKTKQ